MTDALAQYNFMSPEVVEDPMAANAAARREAPVYQLPGTPIFMVSTHDLIAEACAQPAVFSNDFSGALQGNSRDDEQIKAVIATGWPQVHTLLTADPPVHTRFRKLVNLAFSPARVNKVEAHVEKIVDELIDRFIGAGHCEFVKEFGVGLPITVISDQLGVPRADIGLFKQWSDAFADRLGGMLTRDQELACAHQVVAFQHYMKARLDERPLDTAELLSIVQQLMVASNETTTNSLAAGVLYLIQHPKQEAKVRANPDLIKNMVEEVLRLETPTNSMWRVVKQDTVLGGVRIPAGSTALLRFGSGNRDESRFAQPDKFDVERKNLHMHLAFGRGIHACVGAMLSRKEMQVAFRRILARMKNLRLSADNDLKHHTNLLLRGLKKLNIEFDRT